MRQCNKCKVEKPADRFDARRGTCKDCRNERERELWKAKPAEEKRKQAQRNYSRLVKDPEKAREGWRSRKKRLRASSPGYVERQKQVQKNWQAANGSRLQARNAKRRADMLQATPKWADLEKIRQIYDRARRYKQDHKEEVHVHHIVPLKSDLVCGLHVENNLQIVSGEYNLRTHNNTWPDMP